MIQHEVTGVVMMPNEDITVDEIHTACREYQDKFKTGDGMYIPLGGDDADDAMVIAEIVENYIIPDDVDWNGNAIKAGSWLQTVRVYDEDLLEDLLADNVIHEFKVSDGKTITKSNIQMFKSCEIHVALNEDEIDELAEKLSQEMGKPKPIVRTQIRESEKKQYLKARYS
ncbi:XkdF-like putative serine protease domain-containing protein [Enterovibrio nigricans]|uniref:Putative phage serine protease XkdF n=1 Tax=Enterovibrio nigricans DSM 22720 TaxID=1121868 RepID=A0A1T4V5Q7_9GAMM|nr:XkdF-like putative serine protease domain-containing protein [Enterovibrio nigricans]PKF49880.1 hypothetical protein AT251_15635 [Enterovibrio nigricans]SKA60293.1 Putative phage serine protease XkdF [Enterovibrio nigricans DSM 22720]